MKKEKTNEALRNKGLLAEKIISKEDVGSEKIEEVVTRLAALEVEPVQGSEYDRQWMVGYRNRKFVSAHQKYFKIQFFGRGFRISAPGGYNAYHLANCLIDEMRKGLTIPERKAVA